MDGWINAETHEETLYYNFSHYLSGEFVLNPTNTPQHGQLDGDAFYSRFNFELGTPNEISRRLGQRKM